MLNRENTKGMLKERDVMEAILHQFNNPSLLRHDS